MCVFSCVAMKHSLSHGYCTGRMSAQYVLGSHSLQSMHSSDWFAGSLILLGFAYVLLYRRYRMFVSIFSFLQSHDRCNLKDLSSIMFRSCVLHRPV